MLLGRVRRAQRAARRRRPHSFDLGVGDAPGQHALEAANGLLAWLGAVLQVWVQLQHGLQDLRWEADENGTREGCRVDHFKGMGQKQGCRFAS